LSETKRICFVCLGNIVRSPLAENLFKHLVSERGLGDRFEVDSAGTSAWHLGESPDARMRQVAAKYGLEYDGRARQFTQADLDYFDLIIAMDLENYDDLIHMAREERQKDKIKLLREFDPDGDKYMGVPDPYYGGIQGFEETYQIVKRSVIGLLDAIESGALEV